MPPRFFLIIFSCFALSLITIGGISILGEEIDSSAEVVLGGKIKELAFSLDGMANLVFDAMETAGKEIDDVLGEWGYSINSAISLVLIILLLSVIIGIERRIYSRTGKFYSEFLSIESGGVDIDVTKDEFRKLSSYRPLSWIFGSYFKANNLLKDARMNLNDLLLVMDRLSYLRVQITEFRASGADATNLEIILMELETELLDIAGKPMDFSSLEKIQQTWAKRDAERRELGKETGGLEVSSGNYINMFDSPRNSLFSLVVIVLTFASLFLFIATFAEVCFETQYQSATSVCFGDTDSYRNFFYGSSDWPTVFVAGLSLSILNGIFITMLYGGPKALGEVNNWLKEITGKPKHNVNAGLFRGVFCLLMVVVMLELGGWFFNIFGLGILAFMEGNSSKDKNGNIVRSSFAQIFVLEKESYNKLLKNDTTIELAFFFRFFVQLVIGLMFISWGINGYTRVAVIGVIWSLLGFLVIWWVLPLGELITKSGMKEAIYTIYRKNFAMPGDSISTIYLERKKIGMFDNFIALTVFAYILYLTHHYLQSGPVLSLYLVIGLLQLSTLVLVLVFSPIQRTKSIMLRNSKRSKAYWPLLDEKRKLDELVVNSQTVKDTDITPSPAFILEEHDPTQVNKIINIHDSVINRSNLIFEGEVDVEDSKSIKEIEEEQKALVSEMEDKS